MPRPLPFDDNTYFTIEDMNPRTVDVIGDLDQLNPIYFPNNNLVSAINAVPNMMNKTFYVDAVNGDDNNDGSQVNPFKTIDKAFDSTPVGGRAFIYLLSDLELANESTPIVDFSNKNIIIRLNGKKLSKVNTSNRFYSGRGISSLTIEAGTADSLIYIDNSGITQHNYWETLIHVGAESFAFVSFNFSNSPRLSVETDVHLIQATRSMVKTNIHGCDFSTINGVTGIYLTTYTDGGSSEVIGAGYTGVDGTNIVDTVGYVNYT